MLRPHVTAEESEEGVLGMKVRQNGFASVAVVPTLVAAGLVVALVAVIGSGQAAPSTKIYDATVRVVAGPTTTLQLKLTNAAGSKQTLGSANFNAPLGVTVVAVDQSSVTDPDFTVTPAGNVVQFRSTVALKRTESVSANVQVSTTADCGNATWTAEAKQSNDFSGTGNNFAPGIFTNLRPLGSLAIEDIETVDDPTTPEVEELFVPQILVSRSAPVEVSAKDICDEPYVNYGSIYGADATLAPVSDVPARLEDATFTPLVWVEGADDDAGTASATVTPDDVETGDQLLLSDDFTDIEATSNVFDVVEKLCTYLNDTCEWANGNGRIHANAAPPPEPSGDDVPSLGIGFTDEQADLDVLNFSCNTDESPSGNTLININPRDYPETVATITVSLTYAKVATGNGPASSFTFCLSKNDGESWFPVAQCTSTPQPPCILDQKRVTGGDLLVVLFLESDDPWGGLS
jgi:hypothetical protein